MVGWRHQLNGHEFEQAPGDGEGEGSLVCYSPWGHKESETTERLSNRSKAAFSSRGNNNNLIITMTITIYGISY